MDERHKQELDWRIRLSEGLLADLNNIQGCHDMDTRISLMSELITKVHKYIESLKEQRAELEDAKVK